MCISNKKNRIKFKHSQAYNNGFKGYFQAVFRLMKIHLESAILPSVNCHLCHTFGENKHRSEQKILTRWLSAI